MKNMNRRIEIIYLAMIAILGLALIVAMVYANEARKSAEFWRENYWLSTKQPTIEFTPPLVDEPERAEE